MSFPKKGRFFAKQNGYGRNGRSDPENSFADEIAAALRWSHDDSRAGAKIVASRTGASEKTVKNWFAGRYGPSGEHLVGAGPAFRRSAGHVPCAGRASGPDGGDETRGGRTGFEELLAAVREMRPDGPHG